MSRRFHSLRIFKRAHFVVQAANVRTFRASPIRQQQDRMSEGATLPEVKGYTAYEDHGRSELSRMPSSTLKSLNTAPTSVNPVIRSRRRPSFSRGAVFAVGLPFPINGTEDKIGQRPSNVEVTTRHQRWPMVNAMVSSQVTNHRHASCPGTVVQVIAEVKHLVFQEVERRCCDVETRRVARGEEVQQ